MSKYKGILPDLDTAPDVYETPDLPPRDPLATRSRGSGGQASSSSRHRIHHRASAAAAGASSSSDSDADSATASASATDDDGRINRPRRRTIDAQAGSSEDEDAARRRRSHRRRAGGAGGSDLDDDDDPDNDDDDPEAELVRPRISVATATARFVSATREPDFSGRIGAPSLGVPSRRVPVGMMVRGGGRRQRGPRGGGAAGGQATEMLPDRDDYSLIPVVVEKETRMQRLRRLIFEANELEKELEKAKAEEDAAAAGIASVSTDGPESAQAQSTPPDNESAVPNGSGGPSKKDAAGKRKKGGANQMILPGQLLKHVNNLQGELGRLSSLAEGRPDPSLLSMGEGIAGTLTKHAEGGKSLIAQLSAFKAMSMNEEVTTTTNATASISANAASGPTTTVSSSNQVTYELYYAPETAKMTELAKTHELETRVTQIERIMGIHLLQNLDQGDEDAIPSILASSGGTLMGALERLDHHLAVLSQPRQLDNLSRRLKVVLADMERLMELRKKQQMENLTYGRMSGYMPGSGSGIGGVGINGIGEAGLLAATSAVAGAAGSVGGLPGVGGIGGVAGSAVVGGGGGGGGGAAAGIGAAASAVSDIDMHAAQTETERKVNFLFSALDRLDPVIGVLPHLIARLHALRGLHTEAAVFAESLRMISEEQLMVKETGRGIEEALARMEANLKDNAAITERSVKSLDDRMTALLQKIGAAQSAEQQMQAPEPAATVEP